MCVPFIAYLDLSKQGRTAIPMAALSHTNKIVQGSYRIDVIESTPFEWNSEVNQAYQPKIHSIATHSLM